MNDAVCESSEMLNTTKQLLYLRNCRTKGSVDSQSQQKMYEVLRHTMVNIVVRGLTVTMHQ
jgi:hypothetical protein